jgi:hypothetical protein
MWHYRTGQGCVTLVFRLFEVSMKPRTITLALALGWLCAAGAALAADRPVHMLVPPPVLKDVAAMPQIANPVDEAERRINAAVKRLDVNVLHAAKACEGNDWSRSVAVTMRGPGFLSYTVTDGFYCQGAAHPDANTFSIVYDLTTGRPVDWTHLLPASLTGKVALADQADGTRIVTLASKRLFDLYMAGYKAREAPSGDLDECRQALGQEAADGPPQMMVWLDGKAKGLAVEVPLTHVIQACEDPVVIPAAVLKAEGAQPVLLKAFDPQ